MSSRFLRKDSKLTPLKTTNEDRKRRRKKSNAASAVVKPGLTLSNVDADNDSGNDSLGAVSRMRSRTLSLGSAATVHPPHPLLSRHLARRHQFVSESDFFNDEQVQSTGSIFRRRESLSSLFASLPHWKRNGIHIKMEDDCPQGNDETRIFLLTNLGDKKMREVRCVLCSRAVPVYDRYPLLDGAFFLSPINHGKLGVKMKHDGHEAFLLAACVWCLERSPKLACVRCGARGWFPGDRLMLGTLYSFDVLSAGACRCPPPSCASCHQSVTAGAGGERSYSAASVPTTCSSCGHSDTPWLRRLDTLDRWAPSQA